MKNHENFRVTLVVALFFIFMFILSYFLSTPIEKRRIEEEKNEIVEDSLSDEYFQKQLDSTFFFEHSKIPN